MNYLKILMLIALYWFVLGITLSALLSDTLLTTSALEGEANYTIINTSVNTTSAVYSSDDVSHSLKGFATAFKTMFLFRNPIPEGMPTGLVLFINFSNWLLILVTGVCIYRLANPLS